MQFRCDAAGTLGQLRDTPGGGKVKTEGADRLCQDGELVYASLLPCG